LIFPKKKEKKKSQKKERPKKGRIKKSPNRTRQENMLRALAFFPGRAPPCAVRVFFFQAKKQKNSS
jgi:hypothetical protein